MSSTWVLYLSSFRVSGLRRCRSAEWVEMFGVFFFFFCFLSDKRSMAVFGSDGS